MHTQSKAPKTITVGQNRAKISWDTGTEEYRVKFYNHAMYLDEADYFTSDRDDAEQTAMAELQRMQDAGE